MRTVRVYSKQPLNAGIRINLSNEAAKHIGAVLRMRTGDPLILFDGTGSDFSARIASIDRNSVSVDIVSACAPITESPLHITLWHGICRSSRMDYVIQKTTELGVTAIQPVLVERSVVKLKDERARKKQQHWQGVAISAAEQSGRSVVPDVCVPASLEQCLSNKPPESEGLMLHPGGHANIASLIEPDMPLILLTGPEGGFTDMECEIAVNAGFQLASIGPRILRSETAPVAALAIVQNIAGDIA